MKKVNKKNVVKDDWRKPESISDSHIELWRKTGGEPFSNLIRNAKQINLINSVKKLNNKIKIIDYGCAYGDLLSIIKTMNPQSDVYGVELIKLSASEAKKRIRKKNVFTQSCSNKVPLLSNYIDVIYSFDMIEHIPDKKDVLLWLKECNRLLKMNGACIIITPNCNWIMKIIYILTGNKFIIKKSTHPNQYNYKKLKKEISKELNYIKIERGYDLNFFTKILSFFGIYRHLCIIASKKRRK